MSFAHTAATAWQVPASHPPRLFLGPRRPGRRFEPIAEKLLDDDLVTLSMRLPHANQGLAVVSEFSGSRGVADAVAMIAWQNPVQERISLGLPFLINETECSIVAALSPNQTRTMPHVASRLGMSESQLTRRLRALTQQGHVEQIGSGFRRARGLGPVGRSYALEAKVSNWRQGISQALRYSTWCDAAAVVLLNEPRNLADAKSRCATLGLGLAAKSRWIIRPRIGKPNPGLRLAASERFVQQITLL